MKADREPQQMVEQLPSDIGHDPRANVGHEIGLAVSRKALEHRHGHQHHGHEHQPGCVLGDEDIVHHRLHESRVGQVKPRDQSRTGDGPYESDPVGADVAEQAQEMVHPPHSASTWVAARLEAPGAPREARTARSSATMAW